jgi:ABC-type multidrug transport system ATPase subunit
LEEAEHLVGRMVVLHIGKVAAEGTAEDLKNRMGAENPIRPAHAASR